MLDLFRIRSPIIAIAFHAHFMLRSCGKNAAPDKGLHNDAQNRKEFDTEISDGELNRPHEGVLASSMQPPTRWSPRRLARLVAEVLSTKELYISVAFILS